MHHHDHQDGDNHGHHHHHHHDHHHRHHHGSNREGNKKGLQIALLITSGIMVMEFFGGLLTNSLALLSDSGHMLSDVSSLVLSLAAMIFATKAASSSKTFGYYRFEILAALFNGITLFLIAGFIVWEAIDRLYRPEQVSGGTMMLIAGVGLAANIVSAWALMRQGDVKNNVNLRSAYLHVIGDALGSVGALLAGLVMYLFSWYSADPIISVVVALLILRGAWSVVSRSVHILMEGAPESVDHAEMAGRLSEIPGVSDVHDLHVWTITSGLHSMSCHLRVTDASDHDHVLQQALQIVEKEFRIRHATIQVESASVRHGELDV